MTAENVPKGYKGCQTFSVVAVVTAQSLVNSSFRRSMKYDILAYMAENVTQLSYNFYNKNERYEV